MPTEVPNPSQEFAQVTADARAAAVILAESIDQENKVFLSFCESLINNTLGAMSTLNKMEINVARAGVEKQLEEAQKQSAKQAEERKQAITAQSAKKESTPIKAKEESGSKSLEDAFVHSMSQMMMNSVAGQANLHILAEATTTQTISTILSLAPIVLAMAVKNIDEGKK